MLRDLASWSSAAQRGPLSTGHAPKWLRRPGKRWGLRMPGGKFSARVVAVHSVATRHRPENASLWKRYLLILTYDRGAGEPFFSVTERN